MKRRRAIWAAALVAGLGLVALLVRPPTPRPAAGAIWLDLVAELPHADTYHLPVYDLDLSSPDAIGYLDGRWLEIKPDTNAIESAGPAAAFRIPSIPVPLELEIEIAPHWTPASDGRRVTLSVNGKPDGSFEAPGSTRHRLRIPQALLIDGKNVFEVTCPGASSFAVTAFRTAPATMAGRRFPRGSFAVREGGQPQMLQVPGAHVSFSLRPPAGAHLAFGVPNHGWPLARYRVTAEADGSQVETLFSRIVVLGREVVLPLDRFADRPLRLSFEIRVRGGSSAAPLAWEAPRIVVPVPLEASPPSPPPRASGQAQRPPNIVIYVVDALRADHLQPYGYARDTSPSFAQLAREGITFENAFSTSVWTKPSVGGILTGLHPEQHLAVNDVASLDPSVTTLASALKARGYTCLGFQVNSYGGRKWGFDRGFDLFLDESELRPHRETWNSSEAVHAKVLEAADRLREPFFLFIQSADPHYPYDPRGEFRSYVQAHPLQGRPVGQVFGWWKGRKDDGSREHALATSYLIGLYDGSVRHNDAVFGALMEFLRQRGQYDDSAVLLTADHGESFKEHGREVLHSLFYQHTVRVPLILKPPRATGGGRRTTAPVQHIDIAPTVLEWAGVRQPGLPGRSLLEIAGEPDARARLRTIHIGRHADRDLHRFPDGRAAIMWPWKLIQDDAWRPRYELYDLEKDPGETRDLWPSLREDSVTRDFLLAQLRRHSLALSGVPREHAISDEEREKLRALGYLQ